MSLPKIIFKEMTLKEKLGQLIIAGFNGYEYNEHLKTLIEEYPGIISEIQTEIKKLENDTRVLNK